MSELNHILIVEDEESIREPLASYLSDNDYRVKEAGNAEEARKLMSVYHFNLVILDIMMPGENGISLCRHIRETYNTPTIMLTAKTEEVDRIVGLEVGADDYVSKPFSPRELLARMHAVLRRVHEAPKVGIDSQNANYSFGDWVLKTAEQVLVDAEGINISLSTGEYNLLLAMVNRPNRVLSREQLLDLSQGRDAEHFDRSIDNMISRLRRKVELDPKKPKIIKTVWGGGYSFNSDVRQI
ncbi:response regulator [Alteromonadaceae bacterium M269]|nr:response regulator [Alteromonadaceae bacterium M269]